MILEFSAGACFDTGGLTIFIQLNHMLLSRIAIECYRRPGLGLHYDHGIMNPTQLHAITLILSHPISYLKTYQSSIPKLRYSE